MAALAKLAQSGFADKALSMGQQFANSGSSNSGALDQLKNAALARATNAINTVGMPTTAAVPGAPVAVVSEGPSPMTLQQAVVVKTLVDAGVPLPQSLDLARGVPSTEPESGPTIADAFAQVAAEQRGGRRKRKTRRMRRKNKSKRTKTSRS